MAGHQEQSEFHASFSLAADAACALQALTGLSQGGEKSNLRLIPRAASVQASASGVDQERKTMRRGLYQNNKGEIKNRRRRYKSRAATKCSAPICGKYLRSNTIVTERLALTR